MKPVGLLNRKVSHDPCRAYRHTNSHASRQGEGLQAQDLEYIHKKRVSVLLRDECLCWSVYPDKTKEHRWQVMQRLFFFFFGEFQSRNVI